MSESTKSSVSELISDLKQVRDQVRVRIHLGSMEMKDEYHRLDDQLNQLIRRFDPVTDAVGDSSHEVWESCKRLGSDVGAGLRRVLKSLVDL